MISDLDGELRLRKPLREVEDSVIYVAVVASDLGKPALKSTHNVGFCLIDHIAVCIFCG